MEGGKDKTDRQIGERPFCPDAASKLRDAGYAPLAAQVLAARGVSDPEELEPDLCSLRGVQGGAAAAAAVLIVESALAHKKICVVGDYDADGICATTLLVLALQAIDCEPMWLLSNRSDEERAVDPSLVKRAHDSGAELIVTVDGGTSAHAGVQAAHSLGMKIVVTDHHRPPECGGPAPADVLVNPLLPDSGLPTDKLCGTSVALLLAKEIFRRYGSPRRASAYIDLAAVASISDCVALDSPFNRKLVMCGIDHIRKGNCRPAFKVFAQEERLGRLRPNRIAYRIVQLINSAQQMDRPELGVETLLAENIADVRRLIMKMEGLHRERRQLIRKTIDQAFQVLDGREQEHCIVLCEKRWNPNISSTIAAKLSDLYRLPAVVLHQGATGLKGSARSCTGLPVHDVLRDVSRAAPDLLKRWGGHEYAAGLLIRDDLEEFTGLFREFCQQHAKRAAQPRNPVELIDARPDPEQLGDGSIAQLQPIPWGAGFPVPKFHGLFDISEKSPAKYGNGYHYKFSLNGKTFRGQSTKDIGAPGQQASFVYEAALDINNYEEIYLYVS